MVRYCPIRNTIFRTLLHVVIVLNESNLYLQGADVSLVRDSVGMMGVRRETGIEVVHLLQERGLEHMVEIEATIGKFHQLHLYAAVKSGKYILVSPVSVHLSPVSVYLSPVSIHLYPCVCTSVTCIRVSVHLYLCVCTSVTCICTSVSVCL